MNLHVISRDNRNLIFFFLFLLGLDFINTLENLCSNIIVQSVNDYRGFVEFNEAVLSMNLPTFFHDSIISRNTAQIQDFTFWYYYEDSYVYELGIDSDDPKF